MVLKSLTKNKCAVYCYILRAIIQKIATVQRVECILIIRAKVIAILGIRIRLRLASVEVYNWAVWTCILFVKQWTSVCVQVSVSCSLSICWAWTSLKRGSGSAWILKLSRPIQVVLTNLVYASSSCIWTAYFFKSLVRSRIGIQNWLTLLYHSRIDSAATYHVKNIGITIVVVGLPGAYKSKDSCFRCQISVEKGIQVWIESYIKCIKCLPVVIRAILDWLIVWILSALNWYSLLILKFDFWSLLSEKTGSIFVLINYLDMVIRVRNFHLLIVIGKHLGFQLSNECAKE